ncbi:MAG: ankyrin repeat domain-containing protein [Acidobacteriota bacterium]|nr:ankyrin repeat domain-containing protein [Acidobacteriota bacterium]
MSKINLLDAVEVKTPCEQDWKTMRGTDEIRFCDHCAKDVHNLSAMTRKRARKLVAQSNGGICVRYVRRPDGKIQTIKNTLHQITRQTGIAAGVLGTSLTLSTLAYAQATPTDNNPNEAAQIIQVAGDKTDAPNGTISGTISDPNGAVIPFAFVTISNEQTNFYQSANGNQEGFYEFKDVPRGVYKLKFDAGGFASKEFTQISVSGGSEETQNAQLAVQTFQEVVTVGGDVEVENTVSGGIGFSILRTNRMVIAVENDDLEEIKVRVAMGERVNVKDKSYGGNSPLHVAVEHGNLEIAQFLLGAGAKINSKNAEKQTPLMMLDDDATPELIYLLLARGAKINLIDKQGNTALMLAADYAKPEVLQALISAGANVNAVNKQGRTALMAAADGGDAANVKLLLGAGANAQMVDKEGETAMSLTSDEAIKQTLVAYGAIR